MEQKTPMAYERITSQKAKELLKTFVESRIKTEEGDPSYYKYIHESAILNSILDMLISREPTQIMSQIGLIEVRYEVHLVKQDLVKTTFIDSYITRELAEYMCNSLSYQNPGETYRLVTKIYEKNESK